MIFIVSALYSEAKPLIDHFNLKKSPQTTRFQVFANQDIALLISGIGLLSAAVGTSYLLTKYNSAETDIAFNIGIAGSASKGFKIGEPIICNKIIHKDTYRSYYPDILINHGIREGVLESHSHVVENSALITEVNGDIVDMEGAGFYEAASSFLYAHNIYSVKVISDYLNPTALSGEKVSRLIELNLAVFSDLIEKSKEIQKNTKTELLSDEERELLESVSANLKLSTTMNYQLYQLAKQYIIRTGNRLNLNDFIQATVKSKHEGKTYFEQIKERLLYQ